MDCWRTIAITAIGALSPNDSALAPLSGRLSVTAARSGLSFHLSFQESGRGADRILSKLGMQ
jgi:hypothetical protein